MDDKAGRLTGLSLSNLSSNAFNLYVQIGMISLVLKSTEYANSDVEQKMKYIMDDIVDVYDNIHDLIDMIHEMEGEKDG